MRIVVDHKLRIARSELPADVIDVIEDALTIPNAERIKQMEQGIPGWQRLPESIPLYEWADSEHLILPRGFESDLRRGLEILKIDYKMEYNTILERCRSLNAPQILLRPWQETAVEVMIDAEHQGIWKAPPGSGKTVGVLEAVRRLNSSSLILVNTLDILRQWQDRARQFLGDDYPVSLIGGGDFEISDYLTIATVQTLHSRFKHLEETGFFDEFSFVCLDECHHATAETYGKLLSRFSAHYRLGVSATPDKTGDFALATNVLGPIIVETIRDEVDTLVKPKVFRIPTGFSFKYRGRMGKVPSNYPSLLKALIENDNRNALIVATLFLNSGGHNLVCSKRLDHLAYIARLLQEYGYPDPVLSLTGQEPSDQRESVISYASNHPCVILSTLADEALDIPRLDGLFLVFPQRNSGLIEQQVGRIARIHPDKTHASVFDFCDNLIGPLENQWQVRRREVYSQHGYEIETVTPDQIIEGLQSIDWKGKSDD